MMKNFNLIRKNNRERMRAAFQQGLDSSETVAVHGTSLYVVQKILRRGYQPGSDFNFHAEQKHLRIREGDVFVYPVKFKTGVRGYKDALCWEEAMRRAAASAKINAEVSYLCEQFKLKFTTAPVSLEGKNRMNQLAQLTQPDYGGVHTEDIFDFLRKKRYPTEHIDKIVRKAEEKKGVLILYSEKVFERGNPAPGEEGVDVRVQGVSIDSIVGIEPLDQEVYDFLDSL